jgi:2-haloacid dehalogenase
MPKLVVFDAYGTLLDVFSVTTVAETAYPGQGQAIAAGWRDKQIEYSRLVALSDPDPIHGSRHYMPFSEITAAALRYTLDRLQLDHHALPRLLEAYLRLEPFQDAKPVLVRLNAVGIRTAVLSNGDPSTLAKVLEHAELLPHFDRLISVEEARTFKTSPTAYGLVARHFPEPQTPITFVSSNGWDILGAGWFGFQTFWLNRAGLPPEAIGPAPDHVGSSLHELLPVLGIHLTNH